MRKIDKQKLIKNMPTFEEFKEMANFFLENNISTEVKKKDVLLEDNTAIIMVLCKKHLPEYSKILLIDDIFWIRQRHVKIIRAVNDS